MASSLSNNDNPKLTVSVPVPEISITITDISEEPAMVSDNINEETATISGENAMEVDKSEVVRLLREMMLQTVPVFPKMITFLDFSIPKNPFDGATGKYKQWGCRPSCMNSKKIKSQHSDEDIPNEPENVGDAPDQNAPNQNEDAGDNAGGGGGDDPADEDDNNDPVNVANVPAGMSVQRYAFVQGQQAQIDFVNELNTNINPGDYADWNSFAQAVLLYWQTLNLNVPHVPALQNVTPETCFPCCVNGFGRLTVQGEQRTFEWVNWMETNFVNVRANINCLISIRM